MTALVVKTLVAPVVLVVAIATGAVAGANAAHTTTHNRPAVPATSPLPTPGNLYP